MNLVTAHTSKVGLVSWPVEHSLSPLMHNAAFAALELDWVYLPLPVEPFRLEEAIRGLVALSFAGCNVSVPHKTNVMKFLDEKSEAAVQMGAVNTIKIVDGKLIGSNTDPEGFIRALRAGGVDPEGKRVVMMGAGGAARAALYGLSKMKAVNIVVMDVIEQQAISIVRDMKDLFPANALSYRVACEESFSVVRGRVDLLVNASPVGLYPKIDATAWPDSIDLPETTVCFDMVYNPLKTKFLTRASKIGLKTISGLGMLVNQGAVCFETWTGAKAPIDLMYATCLETFAND